MEEQKYLYKRLPEAYYYEFFSEGPKGRVKKVVRYRLLEEFPKRIFNLGFGDWDDERGDVDDKIKTNNSDRQKVLATVADTVMDLQNSILPPMFLRRVAQLPERVYIKWE